MTKLSSLPPEQLRSIVLDGTSLSKHTQLDLIDRLMAEQQACELAETRALILQARVDRLELNRE